VSADRPAVSPPNAARRRANRDGSVWPESEPGVNARAKTASRQRGINAPHDIGSERLSKREYDHAQKRCSGKALAERPRQAAIHGHELAQILHCSPGKSSLSILCTQKRRWQTSISPCFQCNGGSSEDDEGWDNRKNCLIRPETALTVSGTSV